MKHVYSIIVFIALLLCACTKEEPIPTVDQISVERSVTPYYTTADVNMTFSMTNAKEYHFLYSTNSDMSKPASIQLSGKEGHCAGKLKDLSDNTTYYYQLKIVGFNSVVLQEVQSFETKPFEYAQVTTDKIIAYNHHNAIVAISLQEWGSDIAPEWGICYADHPSAEYADNHIASPGTDACTINLVELEAGVTYYVRAYANNSKGLSYGEEISFTTVPYEVPTVETIEVTAVSTNAAICNGNVVSDGDLTITERGVCFSTQENPTVENEKVVSPIPNKGYYSCAMQGLQSSTTYYVRAYAVNDKGIAYGNQIAFTTK